MSSDFSRNYIGVRPGDRAFDVVNNLVDYFCIGEEKGEDVWLEGQIVDGEFVFNARLFLRDGKMGTLIDSFPKGPLPDGWQQRPRFDVEGFELLDEDGELIFSYHVDDNLCVVDANLYRANGELAAHSGQGGLVLHKPVTAKLGRQGIRIG